MGGKAPSWCDQWGTGNLRVEDDNHKAKKGSGGSSKMMADVKAAASAGLGKAKSVAVVGADKAKAAAVVGVDKAKVAAVFGAQKVKSGTSFGLKWIKSQYQKRTPQVELQAVTASYS